MRDEVGKSGEAVWGVGVTVFDGLNVHEYDAAMVTITKIHILAYHFHAASKFLGPLIPTSA